MIPRIIHYCWFGRNPLPESAQKCIASWKKYCPGYVIKEWNERNVDIQSSDYMKEAYEEEAWGFVPDVARLQIVYDFGGIYLDTDVELLKPLDSLLENEGFVGIEKNEGCSTKYIALGLGFGAVKSNKSVGMLLSDYKKRHFRNIDGTLNRIPAPKLQAELFVKMGFNQKDFCQKIQGITVYSSEYFCPVSYKSNNLCITNHTYSIHHYSGFWLSEEEKMLSSMRKKVYSRFGCFSGAVWKLCRVGVEIKQRGVAQTIQLIKKKCTGK